jgi:hypothetical protein
MVAIAGEAMETGAGETAGATADEAYGDDDFDVAAGDDATVGVAAGDRAAVEIAAGDGATGDGAADATVAKRIVSAIAVKTWRYRIIGNSRIGSKWNGRAARSEYDQTII